MLPRTTVAKVALLVVPVAVTTAGVEPDEPALERRFGEVVRPFLETHCLSCHGGEKPKGKLDLSGYSSAASVARDHRVWDAVSERLEAGEMPPEKAPRQPTPHERRAVVEWVGELREREARANAGDPGPVLARRLSNAEFDNTVRDLTGVDIRPTREFPVDPANEAGFDNSGESLAMSPALLKKYLAAARRVADHLVLKPDGFAFATDPAVTETDRDKYCVQRIIAFYERHRVDYADYFLAAWRFRHREALGKPEASLRGFASEAGLSTRYLETVWATLAEPWSESGPLGEVQALWRALPADAREQDKVRRGCERMRDQVVALRTSFATRPGRLRVRGISAGSQPFVLWWDRQLASRRMRSPKDDDGRDVREFCRVFPDTFFVTDRPSYSDVKVGAGVRLLTAGFHLMQGYFRDDAPLCELVLDEAERRELDTLWRELDFVTLAPIRQYKDFIFFERAEPPRFMQEPAFDFARSEDKDATSDAKVQRLLTAYLAKARKNGAGDEALGAIDDYFTDISAKIREVEGARLAAEPGHLVALQDFAARAYRRPLSAAERDDLLAFYRELREKDGLGHEDAVRDAVVSVLMSPHFCYRIDPAEPGEAARPLSGYALASRLSYFLWSSMPDGELLAHAASGDLNEPGVLLGQTRRMLRDPRVRGLATEFTGHWLGFRRFEEHNSVDRERFPAFTNELRRAMYEEPVRFFIDVVSRDRPVLDLLDAGHTFVNPVLARHYGMPVPDAGPDGWVRVDDSERYGRGGLLPMAVFLTANSPGLRTSPVKRGFWVVRRLLGEHIPAPPPEVPELPKDEAKTGDLTLPQLLARHRADKSCAGCHQRFDSVGLVFEGYGPVGERRDRDLGGRSVVAKATFPDGTEGEGLDGLRRYLSGRRRDEFVENLCRKLLAYALGRGLLPSDEPTVRDMRARLSASGDRFGSLVESVVTSPQFLRKRGRGDPRE
jgi:mono/diheme cytochrome c family protein